MTNANFASLAPKCWTSANITTCRNPCGESVASIGICSGGWERGILMSEETQILQIEENIAGLERRIEAMRVHKSADTNAKILELEQIISDLRGHMAGTRGGLPMNRSECIAAAMKEFGVTKYMAKQLANECEKKKIPYEDGIAYMREVVNEKLWNAILYGGDGE